MAEIYDTDICIIGSGVAGSLLACELRKDNVRVRILEAGGKYHYQDSVNRYRRAWNRNFQAPYPEWSWTTIPHDGDPSHYYSPKGNMEYNPSFLKGVGGGTWLWTGMTPRFLPSDFALRSNYGVGLDWPIDYSELELYYLQAEHTIGVSGDSENDQGSPRSGPYPMPAIPMSYAELYIAKKLSKHGIVVAPSPAARNSTDYHERPACCGSNTCTPICPSGAKYHAAIDAERAVKLGAELTTKAVVYRLEIEKSVVVAAHYKKPDGSSYRVTAKRFVLACNSIETARLLLLSSSESYPDGVANRSDQVGRNLMDHTFMVQPFHSQKPLYLGRGPQTISYLSAGRDGDFRKKYAAAKIFLGNDLNIMGKAVALVNDEKNWGNPVKALHDTAIHSGIIGAEFETLPYENNRIQLDKNKTDPLGLPLPHIDYALDDYVFQARKTWGAYLQKLISIIGGTPKGDVHFSLFAHHMTGTARMGKDPTTSVVDANCKCHDHPNLYLIGNCVFPSIGTANPTLTIAALSIRLAKHLRLTS